MLKHEAGWSYVTDETVEDNKVIRFLFVDFDDGSKRLQFGSKWLGSKRLRIETTVNHGRVMHESGAY